MKSELFYLKMVVSVFFYFVLCVISISSSCLTCENQKHSSQNTNCQNSDLVLLASVDGVLTALDPKSGKVCWSTLIDPNTFMSSSLSKLQVYENGSQYSVVPSLDGALFKYDEMKLEALPVNAESLLNHFNLHSSVNIVGGKFKHLYGIHRQSGEICFSCTTDDCFNFKEVSLDDLLIVEEIVQHVSAVDSTKGQKRWHFRVVELIVRISVEVTNESILARNISGVPQVAGNVKESHVLGSFKISLHNSSAGMLNESTTDFSWSYKTSSSLIDVWYIEDKTVYLLDPFENETEFFSIDLQNGKSALLFLGEYMDELFVKKSRKLKSTKVFDSALSTKVFHEAYEFPVCRQSDGISASESNSLIPAVNFLENNYRFNSQLFLIQTIVVNNNSYNACYLNDEHFQVYRKEQFWAYVIVAAALISSPCVSCVLVIILYHMKKSHEYEDKVPFGIFHLEKLIKENKPEYKSRFMQDFEPIAVLGKGGFGVVMEVKNKIDDCHYAVKRIRIRDDLKTVHERVMREVKTLAKLDHPGIVRYFNSWVESPPPGWQQQEDKSLNLWDVSSSAPSKDSKNSVKDKDKDNKPVPDKDNKNRTYLLMKEKLNINPLRPFESIEFATGKKFSSNEIDSDPSEFHSQRKQLAHFESPTDKERSDSIIITFKEPSKQDIDGSHVKVNDSPNIQSDGDKEVINQKTPSKQYFSSENLFHDHSLKSKVEENKEIDHSPQIQESSREHFYEKKENGLSDHEDSKHSENTQHCLMNEENLTNKPFEAHSSVSASGMPYASCASKISNLVASNQDLEENYQSSPTFLYIQMQLCRKESLRNWLDKHNKNRNLPKVINIFCQIIDAVDYFHSEGVMHRDLKPSNILFSLDGAVKVGDFGLATSFVNQSQNGDEDGNAFPDFHTRDVGTEIYMSPEQRQKRVYDCKTDMYSLGLILFELLVPFGTRAERIKALLTVRGLNFPEQFEETFYEEKILIEWLLELDPDLRPTAGEVKSHPLYSRYSLLNLGDV